MSGDKNKYLFQGQERQDELGLGWVQFKWRNHDPTIGRFFNVDPLAHDYVYNSPYAFSENDVISAIELEGLEKLRITNYSKIQSHRINKNLKAKNKVLETPVTHANPRSLKIEKIDARNNEIMRIISFGSEKGFSDDFMVRNLEENNINVPDDVKGGKKTTTVEVIDPKAEFEIELVGVSENKEGDLVMKNLGELNPSKDKTKVNIETGIAVMETFTYSVIEFFINKRLPKSTPNIQPVTIPVEEKEIY